VVIDDAVDGLVSLLQRHIVPNGAQVIPQVRRPRRLDPRIGADGGLRGCGGAFLVHLRIVAVGGRRMPKTLGGLEGLSPLTLGGGSHR
jgi:hypothetical protein